MSEYNFQKGDSVARVFHHWDRNIEFVTAVERVTSTQAIVCGQRFSRQTGREIGHPHSSYRIEPATSELLEEFRVQNRKRSRTEFLRRFLDGNWQSMGEDKLDKVAAALGFETSTDSAA